MRLAILGSAALLQSAHCARIQVPNEVNQNYADLEVNRQQANNFLAKDYVDSEPDDGTQLSQNEIDRNLEQNINEESARLDYEAHDDSRAHSIKYRNDRLSDEVFGSEEYDHDAILGEEDSDMFESLPQEEAKLRFNKIFSKMDSNDDDMLTRAELGSWIRYVTSKYVQKEVDEQFSETDENNDGKLSWKEIEKANYQELVNFEEAERNGSDLNLDPEDLEERKIKSEMAKNLGQEQQRKRDERRFRYADINNDKFLSEEEFGMFLHPEEFKRMRDILVTEVIEDIDLDKDGRISEEEYLKDMWNDDTFDEVSRDPTKDENDVLRAPSWVGEESTTFRELYDEDKDGYLDRKEISVWLIGDEDDNVDNEVDHLFKEADDDKNNFLSRHEVVVEHMDIFVGSQATEFGDVIVRHTEF